MVPQRYGEQLMVKKLELSDLTLGIMMTSTPLLSIPFQCALIEL